MAWAASDRRGTLADGPGAHVVFAARKKPDVTERLVKKAVRTSIAGSVMPSATENSVRSAGFSIWATSGLGFGAEFADFRARAGEPGPTPLPPASDSGNAFRHNQGGDDALT